uniref:Uncharacterized protein n=1 Tax=Hemiselmis andersenii TaxID=464988 RepID=A0A6U2I4R6_HEMAN|mmetsp:Transcript_4647/g.10635  ORF Transcript_4647/g.10635 Transcript_4647/m.10635 type:complete len:266 (-) Transcript_4647:101-898(-)
MVKESKGGPLFQEDPEECVDAQELLIQLSKLRAQMQAATMHSKRLEEENSALRKRTETLEVDNAQMLGRLAVLERMESDSGKQAAAHAKIEAHDPGLRGLAEGQDGYWEARSGLLEKRLIKLAKTEYWLRAELESAKDEAVEARKRQLNAERSIGDLLRERPELAQLAGNNQNNSELAARGSAIFDEENAFAEGLPKTIPARAARCAGMVAAAIHGNKGGLRGSVGRTVASSTGVPNANSASARPGNVWATLMNGGAAGNKMDFT